MFIHKHKVLQNRRAANCFVCCQIFVRIPASIETPSLPPNHSQSRIMPQRVPRLSPLNHCYRIKASQVWLFIDDEKSSASKCHYLRRKVVIKQFNRSDFLKRGFGCCVIEHSKKKYIFLSDLRVSKCFVNSRKFFYRLH